MAAGIVIKNRRRLVSHTFTRGFTLLNRIKPWYRLPLPLAITNLIVLRDVLRAKNLHDTSKIAGTGEAKPSPYQPSVLSSRMPDGSYNDLKDPAMGMAGVRFGRNVPLEDTKPEPEPQLLSPSPRTISQKLLARKDFKPAESLNLMAAAWIQFMTHDWFNHGTDSENNLEIPLEEGDTWHENPTENPMKIRRTAADTTRIANANDSPPTYINRSSHWWDASGIYGSDIETLNRLRSGDNGKLNVDNERRLPLDHKTGVSLTGFNDNWWVGLGLLHTLFALRT